MALAARAGCARCAADRAGDARCTDARRSISCGRDHLVFWRLHSRASVDVTCVPGPKRYRCSRLHTPGTRKKIDLYRVPRFSPRVPGLLRGGEGLDAVVAAVGDESVAAGV